MPAKDKKPAKQIIYQQKPLRPLPNYTLSTVCPACGADTYKLACKVRCSRCGFMWDCSEL
ncbi:hypothetical protein G4Y79_10795 [Phototrophicus methaneseepsis]|uniref:Transposase zinc-ribbon domain-containing protein n=1 Tax=Phototrophicus methaneseepsis TaxID=2710758 RepID=A0A7S8ED86_9CHLR|nr:hypothetical protein [Phototrophicus methaneseepsis]QPC84830.1 hypothetical protein G4Y79_10795 [Phototrophicus methaneseepsis]